MPVLQPLNSYKQLLALFLASLPAYDSLTILYLIGS